MNAKTCKMLRRLSNFHPKQTTKYIQHVQPSGAFNEDAVTGKIVDPSSFRGQYLKMKKAHKS